MNIRVDLGTDIADGTEVVFRSPADCSQVTGMVVYHNGRKTEFAFADAHGNNVGDIDHLFAENAVVKVILDVATSMAFVQNADTNAYIERTFVKSVNGKNPDKLGNVEVPVAGMIHEQIVAAVEDYMRKNPIGGSVDAEQLTQAVEDALTDAVKNGEVASAAHEHSYSELKNKPVIPTIPDSLPANGGNADTLNGKNADDFASSGHTHNYSDLRGRPTIPAAYSHPETHPASMITGLSKVATSGSYEDLSGKPSIPPAYTHPEKHPASMIDGLASVATSGSYEALKDKPTIPVIPDSLPADGGNADTVGGKTVSEIQTAATSAVPAAVNVALQEAKKSGEFDGKTPEKGVDYFTEADKEEFLQTMGVFEDVGRTYVSNNLCDGVYEWGELKSDGSEGSIGTSTYGYRTASFLPVEGGKRIIFNGIESTTGNRQLYYLCEYDKDKNFVKSTKSVSTCLNKWDTSKGVVLQENTKYVRFYIYNGSTTVDLNAVKLNLFYVEHIAEFWTGDGDVFVYVPHIVTESAGKYIPLAKIQSSLTGKKIVYDGDSICIGTHGGGGYAKIIADRFGGSFVNQAIGGGRLRTLAGSSDSFHSVVDNLENLPTDGDLYCFEGGVNDFWTHGVLGTYELNDFTGALDETTVCGALEAIFRYALNTFVGKPICFIITHKIQSTAYGKNPEGNTFKEYRDAMVGICEKYSIPYYDAFSESGLNGWNTVQNNAFLTGNSNGTPDGCHPNEEGYKRYYVPQLISLFERMMPV